MRKRKGMLVWREEECLKEAERLLREFKACHEEEQKIFEVDYQQVGYSSLLDAGMDGRGRGIVDVVV